MSEQGSKSLRILLAVVLVGVAIAALATFLVRSSGDNDEQEGGALLPPGQVEQNEAQPEGPQEAVEPGEEPVVEENTEESGEVVPSRFVPDANDGTGSRTGQQVDEPGPVNAEEFVQARQQALQEAFGEEGPTPCENLCDCAQGQDCQTPPGICMPSRTGIFCCDNPGCEEGMPCRDAQGNTGVCGQ